MKNLLIFGLIISLVVSCNSNKSTADQDSENQQIIVEQEIPLLTVDVFDAEAGKYVNSKIALTGIVDHVCKHSGKRLKLVADGGEVHVDSETRFDDALVGNQIQLKGIVRELRVDESYCLQMEEDNIKKHREGSTNKEQYQNKHNQIQHYRDSMAVAGVDHLSFYTVEFVAMDEGGE